MRRFWRWLTGKPSCLPALIVAGGPGKGPYELELYPDGPEQPNIRGVGYQLFVLDGESLVGQSVLATRAGKHWYFQAPVWN